MTRVHYQLVVFDWDGTLMDSVSGIVGCMLETVSSLGLAPVEESRIRETIGLGIPETLDHLFPGWTETDGARIVDRYRELWWARYGDLGVLFPKSDSVVREVRRRGAATAVATGKSRRGLERDLERSGLQDLFDCLRTVDDAPSKPHPGMLLSILEELGVEANRSLMVGDTTHDLEMARQAGMPAVAVTTGSHDAVTLRAAGPRAVLAGIGELPGWLDGRGRAAG